VKGGRSACHEQQGLRHDKRGGAKAEEEEWCAMDVLTCPGGRQRTRFGLIPNKTPMVLSMEKDNGHLTTKGPLRLLIKNHSIIDLLNNTIMNNEINNETINGTNKGNFERPYGT